MDSAGNAAPAAHEKPKNGRKIIGQPKGMETFELMRPGSSSNIRIYLYQRPPLT